MALPRTLLDPGQLGPAGRKALVPGAGRMMAAKGLAPLPDPGELISVLYQLAVDTGDAANAAAAAATAEGLPDRVLEGALAADIDPRVLDFFAEKVADKPPLIQIVILNKATADETLAELAARLGPREIDLIATNEQRLLRHPAIIGAMYNNMRARMSTVDRAVELAVRNDIKVPDISAWDELVKAITTVRRRKAADAAARGETGEIAEVVDDPELTDRIFAAAAGADGDEDGVGDELGDVPLSKMSIPMKIRLATLGNKFQRSTLIRDPIKMVALAAIKAPGVNEMEAAKYASNHSLADDVISYIANRREWTKLYGVKLSLVQNPKTPIPAAMRFVDHLRQKDLNNVARSKGVSSAVVASARKKLLQRTGGKK